MNTYVQGAGGAVLKRALLALPKEVMECVSALVHDEIVLSFVHKFAVEKYADVLKNTMEDALNEVLKGTGIPPKVDVTVAKTWGGDKEWSLSDA